jgi:Peptidase MA superfamily
MAARISLLFLLLSTLVCQSLPAVEIATLDAGVVRILYDKPLRGAAEEAGRIFPEVLAEVEKALQWRLNSPTTIRLVRLEEDFRKMTPIPPVVAMAFPDDNLVVIDYSRMNVQPFTLATTLKHELCHLLLHAHISRQNLPKWLDEGVAEWVSEGVAEVLIDAKSDALHRALIAGRTIPLRRIAAGFPADPEALALAYAQSQSVVNYIQTEFGVQRLLGILRRLEQGETIDAALTNTLSLSLDDLERSWLEHARKQKNWFTFVATHLYGILFFLGAVLTVIGFVRFVHRKRAYRDWDDEDE